MSEIEAARRLNLKDKFEQDAGECNRAIRRVFTGRQVLPRKDVNHAAAQLSDDYILQPHVRFGGEADIAQTPESDATDP